MLIETAVERFIASKTVQGLQPKSLKAYKGDLRLFMRHAAVHTGKHALLHVFTAQWIEHWFAASLERGVGHNTINRHQTSLREFAKWCSRMRLLDRDPMIDVPNVKKPKTTPRPFTPQARDAMLAHVATHGSVEDKALLGVLYGIGLREGSVVSIELQNIAWPDAGLGTIRLRVKGGGTSVKVIPGRLWPVLHAHAIERRRQLTDRPMTREFLFAKSDGSPWSERMVNDRVHRWGAAVVPPVEHCTGHRWRHTFASDLLARGVDIRVVQVAMDHASLATTQIYTLVSNPQIEAAVSHLDDVLGGLAGPTIPRPLSAPPEGLPADVAKTGEM